MRNAYLETLYEIACHDKNVYAVISDNGAIVYDKYQQDLPKQFINAGISEANMVGMSAGMARRGKIPFAYTIGAFLAYRAYEFILNDVCQQKQNVKLVGIGAGFAYSLLGVSHHSIFDLASLRCLPNLYIFSPASPLEVRKVVKAAYEHKGPCYLRLGTNNEKEIYKGDYEFCIGKGVVLRDGDDITFISTGNIITEVIKAANNLLEYDISSRIINIHTIKPLDKELILKAARKTKMIITVEEHSIYGGLGSAVAEILTEESMEVCHKRFGLKNFVNGYGDYEIVKSMNGMDYKAIVDFVKNAVS